MGLSARARLKFAILGSTYARALANKAQRTGQPLGPMQSRLQEISQQQRPRIDWTTSEYAKRPGALMPTPQQQDMQKMLARVPWAGTEHGGTEHAEATYNAMLRRRGHEYSTPGGAAALQQQINQFGPPQRAPEDTYVRNVPYKGPGASPFSLMDEYKVPGKTPLPAQDTRVGPAPAPAAGARGRTEQLPPQTGPMRGSFEQTQVMGPHRSPWERFKGPPGGAVPPPAPPRRPMVPQEGTAVLKAGAALPSLPAIAGVGIPLAVGTGILASKPGIKANVRALREGGSTKKRDVSGELPAEAVGQADAIHQALLAHGLDPATVRMGIDAPPGSGKTTLARALAQQAGMKHYGLDWEPGNWWKSTVGLGRNVEKMPHAPHAGEVLEHYMLGRTYDPELFDAMVHIHRDPEVLKQQLQQRGHGAYIGDLMDLQKSLGVADLGFETLGGDVVDLGGGVQMKLRPHEGWGNVLDQRLMQAGIDPTGLSRHEKLLSLQAGKRTTGAGWTPYVKSPFTGGETAALAASVPLGVMAARALARRPR